MSRVDKTINLSVDQEAGRVREEVANREADCRQRNVHTTAGQGELQRSGSVTEPAATEMKRLSTVVTPATHNVPRRV